MYLHQSCFQWREEKHTLCHWNLMKWPITCLRSCHAEYFVNLNAHHPTWAHFSSEGRQISRGNTILESAVIGKMVIALDDYCPGTVILSEHPDLSCNLAKFLQGVISISMFCVIQSKKVIPVCPRSIGNGVPAGHRDCSSTVLAARLMMAFIVPCMPSTSLCTHCSTMPTRYALLHGYHLRVYLAIQLMAVLVLMLFKNMRTKSAEKLVNILAPMQRKVSCYLLRFSVLSLREMIRTEGTLCRYQQV